MKGDRNIKHYCWNRGIAGLLLWLGILLSATVPATAHRVTVFAWVEGDTVHVEGKFARGKKVKQGKVTVFDAQGKGLLEGRTDAQGKFSFKAPEKRPLTIVLDAGMGHRAQWTLDSEDTPQALRERGKEVTAEQPGTAPDTLQQAVERALDKKLAPIMKMISESQEKRVSLKDILGGIGYILGLMGVAAYFHYRRRSAGAGEEKE
jgi:nickel transport protein